jgi:hypothetical protein
MISLAAFDALLVMQLFYTSYVGNMDMSQYLTWENRKAQLQLLSVRFS